MVARSLVSVLPWTTFWSENVRKFLVLELGVKIIEPGCLSDEPLEQANNNSIFFPFLPPLNMVIYHRNEQANLNKSPEAESGINL